MKKNIRKILIALLLCIIAYSGYNLVKSLMDYKKGDALYENARQEFIVDNEVEAEAEEPDSSIIASSGESTEIPLNKRIDTKKLKEANEDITGWIYIKDTPVDYPLLKCQTNNDEYIYTTYENRYSSFGSIFIDYRNMDNFVDENTVIYGHNMQNGSMFGQLMKYGKQDYADSHSEIKILTDEGVRLYKVFSAYRTVANSESYEFTFDTAEGYQSFLDNAVSNSVIASDVELTTEDKIITLSTCTDTGRTVNRFVVHAKFMGMEESK